jgi:DNA-binding CsgD family transcriptional regulator
MTSGEAKARAAERIADLSRRGLDVAAFWRECDQVIAPIVPVLLRPCWFTMDPASLIVTSHYDAAIQLPPDYLTYEYSQDDAMNLSRLVRSPSGTSTIHDATGGDPSRSEGWQRFVQPFGGDQQLAVALRTRTRVAVGIVTLYRAPDSPMFTADDAAFIRSLSADLAVGAQRGLLVGEAAEDGPNTPVLIVLDDRWQVQSMTPGAESMLRVLPGGASWRERGALPAVVLSVAGRTVAAPEGADELGSARVHTEDGRWVTVHGAPLMTGRERRTAIIIEPAGPDRISPLLMEVYALTEREKDVTRLVLRGESTPDIATGLFLSPQTVQQHLKSVFEKTGVHTRRELVGRVFQNHYEPRVRDNDARAASGRPVIGTPATGRGFAA